MLKQQVNDLKRENAHALKRERSLQLYIDYLEERVEIAAGIWVAD